MGLSLESQCGEEPGGPGTSPPGNHLDGSIQGQSGQQRQHVYPRVSAEEDCPRAGGVKESREEPRRAAEKAGS